MRWRTDGKHLFVNSIQCDEEGNYDALVMKIPIKDILFVLWRDFRLPVKYKWLISLYERSKE